MTGYCVLCGFDFIDGDATKERPDGTVHRDCDLTEQAIDATWQDLG